MGNQQNKMKVNDFNVLKFSNYYRQTKLSCLELGILPKLPQKLMVINKISKNHIVVSCVAFWKCEAFCRIHPLMLKPKRAAMR